MSECCRACGSIDFIETVMDHGPHYARVDCKDCGAFLKWGKKPVVKEKPVAEVENNKYTGGSGMNNVSLVGRLTKDVEVRYTANNTAVAGFTLAVNRKFKQEGQPDADFIAIVAWQKTAEFCNKYFKKGQQIWLTGRIQARSWEDIEGKKHYVTEVVAEDVGFADSKKDGGGDNGGSQGHQDVPPPHGDKSTPAGNGQQPQQRIKQPWES